MSCVFLSLITCAPATVRRPLTRSDLVDTYSLYAARSVLTQLSDS